MTTQEKEKDPKVLSDKRSDEQKKRDQDTNKEATYKEGSAFPNEGFKVRGPYVEIPQPEDADNFPGPSRKGINPIGPDKRAMLKEQLEGQDTEEAPPDIHVKGRGQIIIDSDPLTEADVKTPKTSTTEKDRVEKKEDDKGGIKKNY